MKEEIFVPDVFRMHGCDNDLIELRPSYYKRLAISIRNSPLPGVYNNASYELHENEIIKLYYFLKDVVEDGGLCSTE